MSAAPDRHDAFARLLHWSMAVLILAAVAALFVWVFPWVESMLPSADLTVE